MSDKLARTVLRHNNYRRTLRNAGCSMNSTATAEASLKRVELAATRWLFRVYADGAAGGLHIGAYMRLIRYLRSAFPHPMRADLEVKIRLLFAECAKSTTSGSKISEAQLAWILLSLGGAHLQRAALIHHTEILAAHQLANATAANRTPSVCTGAALRHHRVATINSTQGKNWRYYTAFPCSGQGWGRDVCLTFKTGVLGRQVSGLRLTNGRFQHTHQERKIHTIVGFDSEQSAFVHNVCILRLKDDQYIMMGGMQGFRRNQTCMRTRVEYLKRRYCLRPLREGPRKAASRGAGMVAAGVRVTRGKGWEWSAERWNEPQIVLSGHNPSGCIDRRPDFTGANGYNQGCEFDGRLSLVQLANLSFRLYARANLRYGAAVGGRFVQTSWSSELERGWRPWRPVRILGMPADKVDLYFFAVETNAVDNATLMALFPVSEPPWACVATAFSRDGVTFSRPVSLHDAPVAFRRHASYTSTDKHSGGFDVRGEDHPVAGLVPDPLSSSHLLMYIHHAFKGLTYRDHEPHVAAYRLSRTLLSNWTSQGLHELDACLQCKSTAERRQASDECIHRKYACAM